MKTNKKTIDSNFYGDTFPHALGADDLVTIA